MAKTRKCNHLTCRSDATIYIEWRLPRERKNHKGHYCDPHAGIISRNVNAMNGTLIKYESV